MTMWHEILEELDNIVSPLDLENLTNNTQELTNSPELPSLTTKREIIDVANMLGVTNTLGVTNFTGTQILTSIPVQELEGRP
ncbi:MAG: hypothetical protein BEN18_07355 [Epulopiscium sp. Nuni2H_MBin001]|nr:MAG: hypothetical protein BEN18_07355 [Epulopiscium sp. Nuni2H_MBin001]